MNHLNQTINPNSTLEPQLNRTHLKHVSSTNTGPFTVFTASRALAADISCSVPLQIVTGRRWAPKNVDSFEVKRGSGFRCWLVTRTLELRQVNCLVHKHTLQLCAGEHAGDLRKLFGIACYERNPETGHHNIVIRQCCAFQRAR